jgi:hypothetical protein
LLISQLPFLYTSMPSRHFATVNLMFGITAAAMLGKMRSQGSKELLINDVNFSVNSCDPRVFR